MCALPAVIYSGNSAGPGHEPACARLRRGLRRGAWAGDTVSVLCPNIPELFELHSPYRFWGRC